MAVNNIKLTPVNIEERKKLDFSAGDTVRVWSKIAEEKSSTKANKKTETVIKFRTQAFEGMVLARKHGTEIGATFTVRRVASGVGVERIFPLFSPMVEKIEVTKKARARRSKLYYVRNDLSYPNELKPKLFQHLSAHPPLGFDGQKVKEVKSQDGMKFILEDDSWLLFRLSGTEPILRIYSEATSQPLAESLVRQGKELAFSLA